jgi:hypothetical protein
LTVHAVNMGLVVFYQSDFAVERAVARSVLGSEVNRIGKPEGRTGHTAKQGSHPPKGAPRHSKGQIGKEPGTGTDVEYGPSPDV